MARMLAACAGRNMMYVKLWSGVIALRAASLCWRSCLGPPAGAGGAGLPAGGVGISMAAVFDLYQFRWGQYGPRTI